MKCQFFRVAVDNGGATEQELNQFLNSHRTVRLDKEFVDDGQNSFWAICVDYLDGGGSVVNGAKSRIDYREKLKPEDFAVYAKLRERRKALAESEAVPPYAIFTNEQLAEMVERGVTTQSAMKEISGVGEARIKKYSDAMLKILKDSDSGSKDEASAD